MNRKVYSRLLMVWTVLILIGTLTPPLCAEEKFSVLPDVVYGHKVGMALTMDVFQPRQANGAGILFMVSGGWYSKWTPPEQMAPIFRPLLDRGFTLFAVRHGSSPKFLVPEIVEDVRRCVRFVRHHAERFQVDPERLGVTGGSAGGHLALVLATMADNGNPDATEELLRTSSRVAAVVAIFPPTDLQPFAEPGSPLRERFPALQFDPNRIPEVSPLYHVTPDDPPTLLIHGDQDKLVPIWHSEKLHDAMAKQGVVSQIVVISGAAHGFHGAHARRASNAQVAWFQKHLAQKVANNTASPKPLGDHPLSSYLGCHEKKNRHFIA